MCGSPDIGDQTWDLTALQNVLIHRCEAQHKHLHLLGHLIEKLPQAERKGLHIKLRPAVNSANSGGVIQPNTEQKPTRCLATQFAAAAPLAAPARGHAFQAVAAHAKGRAKLAWCCRPT